MSEMDHLREALDGSDEIHLAIVFGSVCRRHATPSSDLDVSTPCDHSMPSDLCSTSTTSPRWRQLFLPIAFSSRADPSSGFIQF